MITGRRAGGVAKKAGPHHSHAALLIILLCSGAAPVQATTTQTDWSDGAGQSGPQTAWQAGFAAASGVSFQSIPGQLALSAVPAAQVIERLVAADAGMPHAIAAGDFDGDGIIDVVNTDAVYDVFAQRGAIYLWRQRPDGSFQRRVVDADFYGAFHINRADVDGDGDLDIIATAYYGNSAEPRNGRYAWFENLNGRGTAWSTHLVGELFYGARYVDAADLDGDGDTDLLGASDLTQFGDTQEADIVWFENADGDGENWIQHDIEPDFDNAFNARAMDLNGDGNPDIVGTTSGEIAWWENVAGDGSAWSKRTVSTSLSNVGFVGGADIDGDGDMDLMGGAFSSVQAWWWENLDGAGTQWGVHVVGSLFGGWAIEVHDVDGDGDADGLISVTDAGPAALWFENLNGDGTAWTLHSIKSLLDGPTWIASADIDGNGKLDAIVSDNDPFAIETAQIAWFDVSDFDGSGELTSSILDGGPGADWGLADWDVQVPAGTALVFQVRAGNQPGALGAFSPLALPGDLADVIDPAARFLQYRLGFSSTDPDASPIVHRISVNALLLSAPATLVAGQPTTLSAQWGRPGDTVRFAIAFRPGATAIPGCPDTLAVPPGSVRGAAVVDANGFATFDLLVPAGAVGRSVLLQAFERGSCSVSGRLVRPIVE